MPEREPAARDDRPAATSDAARPARRPAAAQGPVVHVAGFWRRVGAAWIDLAVILPVSLAMYLMVSAAANVHLPPSKTRSLDFWLDLVIASDPAIVTAFVVTVVVAAIYSLVFHVLMGRTVGMKVLGMRVIDAWGERPSIARCAARTGGYLVGLATLALGFLWVGFDGERRGLHDWISGTYVIKA